MTKIRSILVWAAGGLGWATNLAAQSVPAWRLERVATIGGAEASDSAAIFEGVTAAGVVGTADGRLFVLDVQGKRVLEFGNRGQPLRVYGRPGEGPGEFRFPYAIAIGPGDSLWVADVPGRFTVFPTRGEGRPRTLTTGIRLIGQLSVRGTGIVQALAAVPGQGAGTATFAPSRIRLAQFDLLAGVLADTVWDGPAPRRVDVTVQSGRSTSSLSAIEQYGVTTLWGRLSDGTLVVSDTAAYVVRLAADGRTQRSIGSGEPARPLTAADRRRAIEQIRERQRRRLAEMPQSTLLKELFDKEIAETPFAPVVPPISALLIDSQDRIWLTIRDGARDAARIDVYDRSGAIQARVQGPPVQLVAAYGTGLAAVLDRDEADAQRITIMSVLR